MTRVKVVVKGQVFNVDSNLLWKPGSVFENRMQNYYFDHESPKVFKAMLKYLLREDPLKTPDKLAVNGLSLFP